MLGTLAELAARAGGRVAGDPSLAIESITSIDDASPDGLTFATNSSYLHAALNSRAGAVLVEEALAKELRDAGARKPLVIVSNARAALATLLQAFEKPQKTGPFRHPTAVIDETAFVGERVYVGASAVIGANAKISDGCVIDAGAYIGDGTVLGEETVVHPHASVLADCVIGKRVVLHPGSVIGSEGFGFVFLGDHFARIPQVGNVVIGDDVEIGANTCVDRAQTGSTRIGSGTKIDNQCQIGHNCRIGSHVIIAGQCGMAGSTTLGDYVLVGGHSGFVGHNTVGSHVKVAGDSAVWGDLPDGAVVSGRPARPHGEHLRQEVIIRNLPKLVARVEALEELEKQKKSE